MEFYNIFLHAHKGFGYLILLVMTMFLASLLVAMFGYSGNVSKPLRKLTLFTMIFFHIQLLIGIPLLFIFSPGFKSALDQGTLMSDAYSRMTFVEHPFAMIIAAVLLTIINKYMKTNEKLSLKIVFMGILAVALVAFVFPWTRVFGG